MILIQKTILISIWFTSQVYFLRKNSRLMHSIRLKSEIFIHNNNFYVNFSYLDHILVLTEIHENKRITTRIYYTIFILF